MFAGRARRVRGFFTILLAMRNKTFHLPATAFPRVFGKCALRALVRTFVHFPSLELATAANDVALRRTPNYRTEYRPRGTRLELLASTVRLVFHQNFEPPRFPILRKGRAP